MPKPWSKMNLLRVGFLATVFLLGTVLFRCHSTEYEEAEISLLETDSGIIVLTGFHAAPLYGQDIRPSLSVEYWEERFVDDLGNTRIGMASVDSCASRSIPCQGPLNAYRSIDGEPQQKMPGPPFFRYYIGWTGKEVVVWNDGQALQNFLLPINSEGDAVLWAAHHQYERPYYSNAQSFIPFWIRPLRDGYELIGERMVNMCHPLQVAQVRFEIHKSGAIREMARKTVVNRPDVCILN